MNTFSIPPTESLYVYPSDGASSTSHAKIWVTAR